MILEQNLTFFNQDLETNAFSSHYSALRSINVSGAICFVFSSSLFSTNPQQPLYLCGGGKSSITLRITCGKLDNSGLLKSYGGDSYGTPCVVADLVTHLSIQGWNLRALDYKDSISLSLPFQVNKGLASFTSTYTRL